MANTKLIKRKRLMLSKTKKLHKQSRRSQKNTSSKHKYKSKKTKKHMGKMKYICYTGIGAKKKPTHTVKEFLNVMNKESKIPWKKLMSNKRECSMYLKSLKCASCKKSKKLLKYKWKKTKKNKDRKLREKTEKKLWNTFDSCLKCRSKSKEVCDLQDFIKWSGAVPGKC